MMLSLRCLLACALLATFSPRGAQERDESMEPPQEFVLEIGEHSLELTLDEPVTLPADSGNARARLRIKPTRQFDAWGLRFRYPHYYTFEFDGSDPDVPTITVSGNNCLVMVQRHATYDDPDELVQVIAEAIAEEYGDGTQVTETEIRIAGEPVQGLRIRFQLAGLPHQQDLFGFPASEGALFMMFQDSLDPSDQSSKEAAAMRALLEETCEPPTE